jgi:cytochrome c556
MRKGLPLLATAAITAMLASGFATAQERTGISAYRAPFMGSLAAHMGSMQRILTDQTQLIDQVEIHARAVHELSAHIPDIFPEGSEDPAGRARPAVWEQWDTFVERARALQEASGNLLEVASNGGDVQATLAAFAATGQTCGGCHDTFRAPN